MTGMEMVGQNKRHIALALGNFDGLHLGHQSLLNALTRRAAELGVPVFAYTFSCHTQNLLGGGDSLKLLADEASRRGLFERTALDGVIYETFDRAFAALSPAEFVGGVLVKRLGARLVAVGSDYRFGRGGAGDARELARYGARYGFEVLVAPSYMAGGAAVSSSRIRALLAEGRVDEIPALLGRLYSLKSRVAEGFHVGRTIGIPTANMTPDERLALPCPGVYITTTLVGGETHRSLTSIGNNPTVGLLNRNVVETHLIGFDGQIYASEPELFFHRRLRDIAKFESLDALRAQISRDIAAARGFFKL